MDILKNPMITKAARGAVAFFGLLLLIGTMVSLFSMAGIRSDISMSAGLNLINAVTGGAGMALAMSIVTFVLSLGTLVLTAFSRDNLTYSAANAAAALIAFVMGLIISPFSSLEGLVGVVYSLRDAFPGGYVAVYIILMLMALVIIGCNVLGIVYGVEKIPALQNIERKLQQLRDTIFSKAASKPVQQPMNYGAPQYGQQAQPSQPMNYQNPQYQQPVQGQQYQQPMQGQPMMNPQYQQPVQQGQQPMMNPQYQQPVQQAQQPMMNPQYQQPVQQGQQPMMNPQYQQPVQQGQPMMNPQYQQPVQQGQQPMMNPQYQQPVQQGQQPMMNPQYQQPVQQGQQPMMNPQYQQPVQQGQQPMMNPQYQQPMPQPVQPVPQPVQSVSQPVQPVSQPEQVQPVPQPVEAQSAQQNEYNPQ